MPTVRASSTSPARGAPPRYADPAEVFALVASQLRRDPPTRLEMSRWRINSTINTRTTKLAQAITATGVITDKQLARVTTSKSGPFVLLRAIDQAFATLDPYVGSRHHGRLGRFRDVLRREGRYNQYLNPAHGAVIPRRSFPSRPQHVPDHEAEYFHSLMLVAQQPEHLHFKRIEAEFDFPESVRANPDIVMGCVAFIGDLNELDFRRIPDADAWYSIKARTDQHSTVVWKERIERAIAELDASGAHIGVLPELALTDEILWWWRETLLQIKRPPGSSLHWILVGTGPITLDPWQDQQPNRAVLLHRQTGKEVMFQDKCEPFTIDDDRIRDWRLPPHLAPGPLAEWMLEGRERYVIDTNVGRLAILVCEDHGRLMTVGTDLATVAPTHLLIPIFAPPILRYRWQEKAGQEFANTTGSASVVVTSCAVDLPIGEPPPKSGQYGTALIIKPTQTGPSDTWSAKTEIKDAERDPTRVLTFLLPRS